MENVQSNHPAVTYHCEAYGSDHIQMLQFRKDLEERGMLEYLEINTTLPEEQILAGIENCIRGHHDEEPVYVNMRQYTYIGIPGKVIVKVDKGPETPRHFPYDIWVSSDFDTLSDIAQFVEDNNEPRARVEGVYDLNIKYYNHHPVHGIQSRRFRLETTDFESTRAELYPYINMDLLVDLYSESKESIMILQGEPGTGKTSMLKLLMREFAVRGKTDLDIAYVKDRNVLAENSFWIMMTEMDFDILILDDLDEELLPRTENDDNTIVNQLLSFSDGIFQSETKVLVTTNMATSKIDPALVRPGRCFDALRVIPVTVAHARDLWSGLYEMDANLFDSSFSHDIERGAITQARLVSEVLRVRAMGTAPYLLDQSISVRKEYMER